MITLANNHILGQGEQELESTKDILHEDNIPFVGIGSDLSEAIKPYVIKSNGFKICAEYEFTIATEKTCEANPFDPLESPDYIASLKNQYDYVIVLYHGYPLPYLQKVCRKITEKGADLVICQHSDCIGCFEEHQDSTIIYGQGNFIFDDCDSEYWQTSLLINIELKDGINIKYIPIVKKKCYAFNRK